MWQIWSIDSDTNFGLANSWSMLAIAGAGLILSALMIFIMPEIVAYLVATLLLWGGLVILALAFRAKKTKNANHRVNTEYWQVG